MVLQLFPSLKTPLGQDSIMKDSPCHSQSTSCSHQGTLLWINLNDRCSGWKGPIWTPPKKRCQKNIQKTHPATPRCFFGKPHWKSQMLAIPKELFGTLLRLSTPSQLEVYVTWRPVPRNIKWMHWWTAFARRQIAVSGLLIGILCISMPGYIWHRVLTWHTRSQELAEHSRCFGTPLISIRFWASLSVARWLKIPSYVCKGVS